MVRRVRGARREVDEERFVGRHGLLVLDPGHRLVGHVGHEVVVRVVRQFDLGDAVVEVRRPLVGLAADEAVELVEALVRRPAVEGTGDAGLPGGGLVPLAERRGAVAVEAQHFRQRGRRIGNLAGGAREAGRHLGDEAHVDGVVVAAGLERGARRRAQGRGVEVVVAQSALAPSRSSVGVAIGPPKAFGRAEAQVVDQDDDHVRRARGRLDLEARRRSSRCAHRAPCRVGRFGSWIGRTVRSRPSVAASADCAQTVAVNPTIVAIESPARFRAARLIERLCNTDISATGRMNDIEVFIVIAPLKLWIP